VVAVGAQDAGKDVFVTVVPAPPPMTREEWLRFVEQTAGSITDPTFERQPQGSYEDRETFES
jgi:hypothetical protein